MRDGIPGNKQSKEELEVMLRAELGDAFVYLDLLAQSLGIAIGEAAVEVFNMKSEQIGCPIRIVAAQHLKREQEPAPCKPMDAEVKALLKRVDEDSKGTRCLTMAEVTLCLNALKRLAAQPPQELVSLREDALFQAANTAARNLATSMNLRQHPDSCECYGCGLNRAVVNFALARAKENVRPIVERELRAEKWAGEAALTRGASE